MATTLLNLKTGVYRRLGDRQFAASGASMKAPEAAVTESINEAIQHLYNEIEQTGHFPLYKFGDVTFGNDHRSQIVTLNAAANFSLRLGNVWTESISNSAAVSVVETALRAIDPFTPFSSGDQSSMLVLVTGDAGGPYTVTWPFADSDAFLQDNVHKLEAASHLTATAPTVTSTSSGTIEKEIDIDKWLRADTRGSSVGAPDYRGSLYADIAYGTGDVRVPIPFAEGGQFSHQWVHQGGSWIPRSRYSGIWWNRFMYLRGRKLGFVDRPTAETTIRVHYSPLVPELAVDADTLLSIGAPDMEHWKHLIACRAALQAGADINTSQYKVLEREYGRREGEFLAYIAGLTSPVELTELERY